MESESQLGSTIVEKFLMENGTVLMNGKMASCDIEAIVCWLLITLALVTGFVNLPSVMIPDSTEVLYELMCFSREVSISVPVTNYNICISIHPGGVPATSQCCG